MNLGTFGRLGDESKGSIKLDIKERGCAGVIWIKVSPDKVY
jgi:hypothetical protein